MESAGGWWPIGIGIAFSAFSFSFTDSHFSLRAALLLMRPRHFDRSCAVGSQGPIGMSKSFRESLRVSSLRVSLRVSCSVSSGHIESAFPPLILHGRLSLEVAYQAFL